MQQSVIKKKINIEVSDKVNVLVAGDTSMHMNITVSGPSFRISSSRLLANLVENSSSVSPEMFISMLNSYYDLKNKCLKYYLTSVHRNNNLEDETANNVDSQCARQKVLGDQTFDAKLEG